MKTVIINTSPKGEEKSNTMKITGAFLRGMTLGNKDMELREIELNKLNINPCSGFFPVGQVLR